MNRRNVTSTMLVFASLVFSVAAEETTVETKIIAKPNLFTPLTEPPCSYCSTQQAKGLILPDDQVIAWLRGDHNGGAFPLRHFLAGTRVVNDTYGLFFFDPDGGYVAAYEKDYGYSFHGWRNGVMVTADRNGNLWSALSGRCISGPLQGQRLKRVPSMTTQWHYWLMLHPESTAYDLFDGKRYDITALPAEMSPEARAALHQADDRMPATSLVLGVESGAASMAFPLETDKPRACYLDKVGETEVAVFWYEATQTAVAFHRQLDGQRLTFYADEISPESAPIKDRETGTRWTMAGRGIDGPLRGKELQWVDSIQCRWYAWAAEYPQSKVHDIDQ